MFCKMLDEGQAGDIVGCLLRDLEKNDIKRGQVLAKPGTITPHKKFACELYVLKKEEGGRHTPFFTGYRPQFYIRTADVTGICALPAGTKMAMPGDTVSMTVERIKPVVLEEQGRFAIREGGKTVGVGVITTIIEWESWPKTRGFLSASGPSTTRCSLARSTADERGDRQAHQGACGGADPGSVRQRA